MFKQKSKLLTSIFRVSLPAMLIIGVAMSFVSLQKPQSAHALTNSTLNFQARLLTIAGSVVPDGTYNVEFKIYNALTSSGSSQGSCSGDAACLWTETRTSTNKVRVVNGYMTVNLGSVNAFASTINWDQEMWLTMNIGGTGTPGWDGEMTPRLKLTAVPYAFRAGSLVAQNGSNINTVSFTPPTATRAITIPDESGTICLQASSACGFLTSATANTNYIQNQNSTSQTANFRINGTGRADIALQSPSFDRSDAGALNIGGTNATGIFVGSLSTSQAVYVGPSSASTNVYIGAGVSSGNASTIVIGTAYTTSSLALRAGTGNLLLNVDGVGSQIIARSSTNSTTALQIQSSSNVAIFNADTANSRIGIANSSPAYALDVTGDVNASSTIRVGGTIVCDASGAVGCTAKSGSGFYIHNQTTAQASNLYVQSATTGTVAAKFQAFNGGTGNIIEFLNGTGTTVGSISSIGSTLVKPSSDSTTAFQVQPSGSTTPTLSVDTSNNRVGIGGIPDRTLDVYVNNTQNTAPMALLEQGGTGDSTLEFKTPAKSFIIGADASDASSFKISSSTASASGTNFGYPSASTPTSADSGSTGTLECNQYTSGVTGTITSISVYIMGTTFSVSPNNQFQVGIFADNGLTPGSPTTFIANSASGTAPTSAGWSSVPISASVVSGTKYFLCYESNGVGSNANNLGIDNGGTGQTQLWKNSVPIGTWADFGGAGGVSGRGASGVRQAIYATVVPTGATYDSFSASLFKLGDTGQANFQNSTNSATSFQIQSASATTMFNVDTTNSRVSIGVGVTGSTTPTILVLANKTDSSDPTGVAGAMYYNASSGSFRCFSTRWQNCVGGLLSSSTAATTVNTCTGACGPISTATGVWVPDFCVQGRVIHVYASGIYSTTASPTLLLNLYIGTSTTKTSDTILGTTASAATAGTGASNYGWEFDGYIICNSTTSVVMHGSTIIQTTAAGGTVTSMIGTTTTNTITNTLQNLYLFPAWGASSASNTITANQLIIDAK